jgi:hypothetical protein
MREPDIVTTTELAVLRQVLDDHCREAGIDENSALREAVAARIMSLYRNGICDIEQIKDTLRKDQAM